MRTPEIARYCDLLHQRTGAVPDRLLSAHYETMGQEQFRRRQAARRSVVSLSQWRAERERLLAALWDSIGHLPEPEPEVVDRGEVEVGDVVVRRLLLASYPGNWVPADIYLPREADFPIPGVVLPCGHSLLGRVGYSERADRFVRAGYAAMTLDYVGNGARQIAPYFTSTQHNLLGRQLSLAGHNLLSLFIQETMAAVTVLQAADEVDGERIAITGSSGGGTMSVYAAACDPRIRVAAPSSAVHSFSQGVLVDDSEQCLFDMVQRGLGYEDVMAFLVAPRPLLIAARTDDIWPLETTRYAHEEARGLYHLLGHEDRIGISVAEGGHGCAPEQLEQIVSWFDRWLKPDGAAAPCSTGADELPPYGDKLAGGDSANIYEQGCERPGRAFWRHHVSQRAAAADLDGFIELVQTSVPEAGEISWEEIDRYQIGALVGMRIVYTGESGVPLPAEVLLPPGEDVAGATVLLDQIDRRDMQEWQVRVAAGGRAVIRPDLRGWGETAPAEEWEDRENWCQNTYSGRQYTAYALAHVVGRHLVLDRVRDALAAAAALRDIAAVPDVRIWGRGQGAWIGLLAALCEPRVSGLVLERMLCSFRGIMELDAPVYGVDSTLFGLLRWNVDVPELLAAVSCDVEVRSWVDGLLHPVDRAAGRNRRR